MTELTSSRSLGLDAIFQYTGSGVQLFSGAIFYIIIVRMFSTTAVGAIALFLAIVGLFNIVFSFGLGTAAQHFTSYSLGIGDYAAVRKTIRKMIGFSFLLSLIGFGILLISSGGISLIFLHSTSYSFLVRLLSVVLLGNILFGILNGALLGLQNFRLSAIINIIIWVFYYFGSIALALYARSLDVIILGWIIGVFMGVSLELVIILRQVSRYPSSGKAPGSNFILKYSLPVLLSGIIGYGASYMDRFVVAGLLNLSSLGVYNFALLIASSIGFLATPFNNILMPKFSELFGEGRRGEIANIVDGSSVLLSSIYVPAALGIAALSPMILELLGGYQYTGGYVALAIIMGFSALFISVNILTQAIASVRKTHLFIYSSAAALAANVVLSIVLIPRFGLIGAAFGFSSVYAATFVIQYYFARKNGIVHFNYSAFAKVWIASIIMFAVVMSAEEPLEAILHHTLLLLPLYIALGFVVYVLAARILQIFKREDKDLIISLFPDKYRKIRRAIEVLILH